MQLRSAPALLFALFCLICGVAFPGAVRAAVQRSPEEIEALTLPVRVAPLSTLAMETGLTVNTSSRYATLAFFHTAYLASVDFLDRMNWTGDTANCDEGTVSDDFHEDVLRRINFFRAMAGLNANITLDPVKNAKSQKAALMMSRNHALSHFPPDTWICWSQDGYEAAGAANLSRGSHDYTGPAAIDGLMLDAGDGNTAVGHRRWLLFSGAREMGNGGVPRQVPYGGAAVIWVIGDFNPLPSTPVRIAWPPAGYVPWQVIYPRWSFGLSGASASSFNEADVYMSVNGTNLPVTIIDRGDVGYGDHAIVWEPQGWTPSVPAADTTYHVVLSNVSGTASSTYHYAVTVIDPYDPGLQSELTGPVKVSVGEPSLYMWSGVEGGSQHFVRVYSTAPAMRMEGAESDPPPRVLDFTSPDYSLITSALAASGDRAFHMAFPDFAEQSFEIDGDFVPSSVSELRFQFRRRYSTVSNVIGVDISLDEGFNWQRLWTTSGVCSGNCSPSAWDDAWQPVAISLGAHAGQPLRVRFIYSPVGPSFVGTGTDHGVFLDEIEFTYADEIVASVIHTVSDTLKYTFIPDGEGTYLLSVSAQRDGYTFPFGPAMRVQAGNPPISVITTGFYKSATNFIMDNLISGGPGGGLVLNVEQAPHITGVWHVVEGTVYDSGLQRLVFPRDKLLPSEYFRVIVEP